jgi:hypothetical protein
VTDLLPGMPAAPKDQPAVPVPTSREAALSSDGLYRYELTRRWADGPTATWTMLNPSTADHLADDPTIRRVMQFSRAFGCGACIVVNLYALRATDPAELRTADDPVGPFNDAILAHHVQRAADTNSPLMAAWGALAAPERIAAVLTLPGMGRLTALATTKAGQPKHPLYLPGHLTPQPWSQP